MRKWLEESICRLLHHRLSMDSASLWSLKDSDCTARDPYNGTKFNYSCPREYNCSGMGTNSKSIGIGPIPTYISIVSCSLSCIGSVLIFLTFCCIKEVRKSGVQRIITFLALADFMQAFGYLLGAWNYLTHYNFDPSDPNYHHMCDTVFQITCVAQSFLTSWASIVSFVLTCLLAIEFYLAMSGRKGWTGKWKLFLIGIILSWGAPLIIVIVFASLGKLGYAPYAAANWCFVKSDAGNGLQVKEILIVLLNGKFWEILTYAVVIVLYCITRTGYQNQTRRIQNIQDREQRLEAQQRSNEVNNRLLLIPIVFLLLRMWGTIQFFVSIGVADQNYCGCVPKWIYELFLGLGILQAIGDGGQGWGNAFLYIFISPTIRQQLFRDSVRRSISALGRGFTRVGNTMTIAADDELSRSTRLSKHPTIHTADIAQLAPPSPAAQLAPSLDESQSITASLSLTRSYGSTQPVVN